jgi:phosphoenolpyruvate carboxylase
MLLGKPLSSTLDDISKAASVRQQLFKKEWYRNEPDIKGCQIK